MVAMAKFTADIQAIIQRAILSFVATVNADGTPNLSPKASLTVRGDDLYFADIASPRTVENLKRNPAVEINVVDIFQRRGYRFTGHAVILSPGDPAYRTIADWVQATNGPEYPVDHVVRVDVASIAPLLSPAHVFADPPRSQEEISATYRQKYGVPPDAAQAAPPRRLP
jgi:hypothetical protein